VQLVHMRYDPDVIQNHWLSGIIRSASEVLAEELGTPEDGGESFTLEEILIRPQAHHEWATHKRALEFVIPNYPLSGEEDHAGLTERISKMLSASFARSISEQTAYPLELLRAPPIRCLVQLELGEVSLAESTVEI
jgi:hypothetical protein